MNQESTRDEQTTLPPDMIPDLILHCLVDWSTLQARFAVDGAIEFDRKNVVDFWLSDGGPLDRPVHVRVEKRETETVSVCTFASTRPELEALIKDCHLISEILASEKNCFRVAMHTAGPPYSSEVAQFAFGKMTAPTSRRLKKHWNHGVVVHTELDSSQTEILLVPGPATTHAKDEVTEYFVRHRGPLGNRTIYVCAELRGADEVETSTFEAPPDECRRLATSLPRLRPLLLRARLGRVVTVESSKLYWDSTPARRLAWSVNETLWADCL